MSLNPNQLASLQALLASQATAAQKPLLEFKCGICNERMSGSSIPPAVTATGTSGASGARMIYPDKRHGTLRFKMIDGMLHLQWYTRPNESMDLDIVCVPNQTSWEKVDVSDGRVYLFKYNNDSTQRHFFWLQEPTTDKDDEYTTKIKQLLVNPAAATTTTTASSTQSV
jgi:hypothetical protein